MTNTFPSEPQTPPSKYEEGEWKHKCLPAIMPSICSRAAASMSLASLIIFSSGMITSYTTRSNRTLSVNWIQSPKSAISPAKENSISLCVLQIHSPLSPDQQKDLEVYTTRHEPASENQSTNVTIQFLLVAIRGSMPRKGHPREHLGNRTHAALQGSSRKDTCLLSLKEAATLQKKPGTQLL